MAKSACKRFSDLNFFPMTVESNIYGMTSLDFDEGNSKVLVATHDCQVFCIDYNKFRAQAKEIEFTYIPSGAKIVSIDAFKRLNRRNDFVIGITHSLTSSNNLSNIDANLMNDKNQTFYLNIYASGAHSSEFDLDYIAQGCQTIPIGYVPYHLYHTDLIVSQEEGSFADTVWLLSGGDRCIHLFQEDRSNQCFVEKSSHDTFPEFDGLASIALWIDCQSYLRKDGTFMRLTAVSLESGTVMLSLCKFNRENRRYELSQTWSHDEYTTIVPSVRLMTTRFRPRRKKFSSFLNPSSSYDIRIEPLDRLGTINLLAVSSTETSLVFEDVTQAGLSCPRKLPNSQRVDCCTTSCVADIDFDGYNEIMIGTYGQELLIYKYDCAKREYFLSRVHELNYPIYSLAALDITSDLMMDLVILVTNGVHILQANVDEALEICRKRVKLLMQRITL